nr:hypothetical protein BaRGS_000671 [Batillaria attramentaria]
MEALAVACGDFPPDATPTDAVTQAFMEADVNEDGKLSEEEAAEFAKMLDSAKPDGDVLIGALSQACPDLDFAPDTQVSQLVQDAFQDVDANKDGQLNADEVAEFATMIVRMER